MHIVDAMQINTLTLTNQVEDSLLLEKPNNDTSDQINEDMKCYPYKLGMSIFNNFHNRLIVDIPSTNKWLGITELPERTFPCIIFYSVRAYSLMQITVIYLPRSIKPHFIWVVYHTEFQFSDLSSVVKIDFLFYIYRIQLKIALEVINA